MFLPLSLLVVDDPSFFLSLSIYIPISFSPFHFPGVPVLLFSSLPISVFSVLRNLATKVVEEERVRVYVPVDNQLNCTALSLCMYFFLSLLCSVHVAQSSLYATCDRNNGTTKASLNVRYMCTAIHLTLIPWQASLADWATEAGQH